MLQSERMKDGTRFVPVVILGAGVSGIAMACRLRQRLGFSDFEIYERGSALGGTWHNNSYPGCACDIPAIFYSFSFNQNPGWTGFYPKAAEIAKYMRGTCDKFGVTEKIRCNVLVDTARWLEDQEVWELSLTHLQPGVGDLGAKGMNEKLKKEGEAAVILGRERVRCKVFVPAIGTFIEANEFPSDVPGLESFKGPVFHTARWDHSVDFTGKNVVVIGAGCTAAQVVPNLMKAPWNAKSVTQLMREPSWVVPPVQPPGGNDFFDFWSKLMLRVPVVSNILRLVVASGHEVLWPMFKDNEAAKRQRKTMERVAKEHMEKLVPKKYHEILTPGYGLGCKRMVFDPGWFASLQNPNVELTTKKLSGVTPRGVIIGPEYHYPPSRQPTEAEERQADVIVISNGFQVSEFLISLKIYGKGGKSLHDVWKERGGSQAYRGTAMDGFPNMFIMYGPNTSTGHSSVILASENQTEYALHFIGPIVKGEATTVDVKRSAEEAYTEDLQERCKERVWATGGCQRSWYIKNDWNSTTYPYSQIRFTLQSMFPKYHDWNIAYTSKGIRQNRLRRILKYWSLIMAILAVRVWMAMSISIRDIPTYLRSLVRTK